MRASARGLSTAQADAVGQILLRGVARQRFDQFMRALLDGRCHGDFE
jgi:hypothetical protein